MVPIAILSEIGEVVDVNELTPFTPGDPGTSLTIAVGHEQLFGTALDIGTDISTPPAGKSRDL